MDTQGLTCPNCGYNLTGLEKPRCPECGTEFDPVYLRGINRKYPGTIILGTWTVKYIPPLVSVLVGILIFWHSRHVYLDLLFFNPIFWLIVVWLGDIGRHDI